MVSICLRFQFSGFLLLPRRALSLVREWLASHREELAEDWALALAKKPLKSIEPLA